MERARGSDNAGPTSLLQECGPYTRLMISWCYHMERAGWSDNAGPASLLQECGPYTRLLISWSWYTWDRADQLMIHVGHGWSADDISCEGTDQLMYMWTVCKRSLYLHWTLFSTCSGTGTGKHGTGQKSAQSTGTVHVDSVDQLNLYPGEERSADAVDYSVD